MAAPSVSRFSVSPQLPLVPPPSASRAHHASRSGFNLQQEKDRIANKEKQGLPLFHYEKCIAEVNFNNTGGMGRNAAELLNQLETEITRGTKLTYGEHQFLKAVRANTKHSNGPNRAKNILTNAGVKSGQKYSHAPSPHARGYQIGQNRRHHLDQAAQSVSRPSDPITQQVFSDIHLRHSVACPEGRTLKPFYLTPGERFVLNHACQCECEFPMAQNGAVTNNPKQFAQELLNAAVRLPATPPPRRAHHSTPVPLPHHQAPRRTPAPSARPENASLIAKRASDIVNAVPTSPSANNFNNAAHQLNSLLETIKTDPSLNSIEKPFLINHVYEQKLHLNKKWDNRILNLNPPQKEQLEQVLIFYTTLYNKIETEPNLNSSQKTGLFAKLALQKEPIQRQIAALPPSPAA